MADNKSMWGSFDNLIGEKIYFEPDEQHICRSLSQDGESLREMKRIWNIKKY